MRCSQTAAVAALVCCVGCGRSGFPTGELSFVVQVVDGQGDPVPNAEVHLRAPSSDAPLDVATTSDEGVAVLEFLGAGTYDLDASTDARCCLVSGTARISVSEPGELVLLETVVGPCPTWTPPSCS